MPPASSMDPSDWTEHHHESWQAQLMNRNPSSSSAVSGNRNASMRRTSRRQSSGGKSIGSGSDAGRRSSLNAMNLARRLSTASSSGGTPSPPPPTNHSAHVPQIPTVGLLSSVAGAAHFSSGTTHDTTHETFRPTFADGEDKTRLDPVRQEILDSVLALFCGKPTLDIFARHWTLDAIFEDPLSQCKGFREYSAQWYCLAKMVSSSQTLSHRVLASTSSPSRIVYSQKQEYTLKLTKKKKAVQSMVVIHLDQDNKITMLEDKWHGEDQPSRWGAKLFRRLNAKTLPLFIRVPKLASLQNQTTNKIRAGGQSTTSGQISYPPRPPPAPVVTVTN